MKLALLHESPVPLYQQITDSISYKIATGRLKPGESLPPLRGMAKMLGVNMHTVRRSYRQLASQGLVESRVPTGTVVASNALDNLPGADGEQDKFLSRIIEEAQTNYNLAPYELAHRLVNWFASQPSRGEPIYVIECNRSQCMDHAQQIQDYWRVEALPWSMDENAEAPPGPAVATYYHHDEIRQRWPEALPDIHFVTIQPDHSVVDQVAARSPLGKPSSVIICEQEYQMATNMVIDLTPLLASRGYNIETRIVQTVNELLIDDESTEPVIFSPKMWSLLSTEERANPRVIRLYYGITLDDLVNLGKKLALGR